MRTRVPRTLDAARMDSAVSPPRCVTLLKQTAPRRIAPFFPLLSRSSRSHTRARPLSSGVVLSDTHHQLCNPPYSAARLNKWLVSEAVSVYRLPILSLFWGLKGRLSLGDGQSPGFIDFFPSPLFVRSVQTADLKDRRDRTHAAGPVLVVDHRALFFLPLKGEDEDERQREWKMIGETQSKASAASLPLPPTTPTSTSLTLISLSPPSILTQRKYCTLSDSH